jgi:hypothetical protein
MAKSKKSVLSALGKKAQASFDAHKNDQVELPSAGGLPAGLDDVIAKLVNIDFGVLPDDDPYNPGKPYFSARGIVVEPEVVEIDGREKVIKNLSTYLNREILADTPDAPGKRRTFDQHFAYVLNHLRMLGIDTEELDFEDLEDACQELVDSGTYFRFRTWQGKPTEAYPNPRVNHEWMGEVEGYADIRGKSSSKSVEVEDDDDDIEEEEEVTANASTDWVQLGIEADEDEDFDVSPLEEEAESQGLDPDDYDTYEDLGKALSEENVTEDEEDEEDEEEDEEDSEDDSEDTDEDDSDDEDSMSLEDYAKLADDEEDDDAMDTISAACEEEGLDEEDYDTWADCVKAIRESQGGSSEDEEEDEDEEDDEEESSTPEKDDVVGYKPPKKRKAVECVVTAVYENLRGKKRICNLKNLDSGEEYKSVSWDDLTDI